MKVANDSVENPKQENDNEINAQENVDADADAEMVAEKDNVPPETLAADPLETDEIMCEEANPVADVGGENKENGNAIRRSFVCPFCDEIFLKKSLLAAHKIYHRIHPKKKAVKSEKSKRKRDVSLDDDENDEYDNEEPRYVIAPRSVPTFGVLRPQGQAKNTPKMRKVVLWSPE